MFDVRVAVVVVVPGRLQCLWAACSAGEARYVVVGGVLDVRPSLLILYYTNLMCSFHFSD